MEKTSSQRDAATHGDTSGDTGSRAWVDGWPDLPSGCESRGQNHPDCPLDSPLGGEGVGVGDLTKVRGHPARRAKAAIRRRVLAARRDDPPTADAAKAAAAAIARRVLELPELAAASCVAAYVPLPDEPDTSDLLAALRELRTRVLLPAVRADLGLDFREHTGVLVPGAMGTAEPPPAGGPVDLAEADAVVVPAVAADRAGRRLGRGGGSYDRALGALRSAAFVVAVVHDHELHDELPDEPHDRRVTAVVTPLRTWRCPP